MHKAPDQGGNMGDPQDAAQQAGLAYVNDHDPGIHRRRWGKTFRYVDARGKPVRDAKILERIRKLAIPPAYEDVWICASAHGHIQATGRDARGRKQYRYHARFRALRDGTKFRHIIDFARALPTIRERIDQHLALRGLPREKVLAAIVRLLETTMIRVGNADYARQNKSYGLTTLKNRHVAVNGSELRFNFKGKSGKQWRLGLRDRRIAKIVKASQDLPGQHLFQYLDDDGEQRDVGSSDINAYLRDISGVEITAKDFRTWNGTVLAGIALSQCEKVDSIAAAKRNINDAIKAVAARLGNTPTICRKCYVHPAVLESYLGGTLTLKARAETARILRKELAQLSAEEGAILAFLHERLSMENGAAA